MPDCSGVPRVGDGIYAWEDYFTVKEVIWFPTKEVLRGFSQNYWCGYHISELEGTAKIEAIIYVQ